jgi:predicted Kef-type K+ transport protein
LKNETESGFLAIKIIPPLLPRVKTTCNPELLLLVAIAICLGTAALGQAVGLSVALGLVAEKVQYGDRRLARFDITECFCGAP